MFIEQPFDKFLGFQYERVDKENIKVTLPIQPLYMNSAGVVHGGIISSLADVAMCNTMEVGENNIQKVVTIDLNVSFMKGAIGDYLVAHATLVKEGKTLSYVDCYIYDDQETMVAKAKGIFYNNQN